MLVSSKPKPPGQYGVHRYSTNSMLSWNVAMICTRLPQQLSTSSRFSFVRMLLTDYTHVCGYMCIHTCSELRPWFPDVQDSLNVPSGEIHPHQTLIYEGFEEALKSLTESQQVIMYMPIVNMYILYVCTL